MIPTDPQTIESGVAGDAKSSASLLRRWHFRLDRMQGAYYEAARRSSSRRVWLGGPAAVLSAAVSTQVFLAIAKEPGLAVRIITGLVSVAAAVLATLQTFMGYSEIAERHRVAGAKFANLKHRVELLLTFELGSQAELRKSMESIEMDWAKVREESPSLPSRLWKRFDREFDAEEID